MSPRRSFVRDRLSPRAASVRAKRSSGAGGVGPFFVPSRGCVSSLRPVGACPPTATHASLGKPSLTRRRTMGDCENDTRRLDVATITAVAGGDRAALATLYDRHAGLVLALARRLLGDAAEAEDLVHDVFVEVWQRAGRYDPERASVRGFILMIARSRALDRKRSARFARRAPMGDDHASTDRAPSDGSDVRRMQGALGELPEAQREVVWLGYFEGLSSSEMAERIGIPAGTVKSRTAAALRTLRERFGRGMLE